LDLPTRREKTVVFDIETYRPTRGVFRDRRIELNPEDNYVTVIGIHDGKTIEFSPITPLGQPDKEESAIKWIATKFEAADTIVGFNILKFDIPYLIYKSEKYAIKLEFENKRLLDLFWFVPAWLENTRGGRKFCESYNIGRIFSLNKVEKYLLNKQPNPISHEEYFKFYEEKEYAKIIEKLRVDLNSTFELLHSTKIAETLDWLQTTKIDPQKCLRTCAFRVMHSITAETAHGYCPLICEKVGSPTNFRTKDVIGGQHLPDKETKFLPRCLR
jgi:DNA polymerase elongation subunit (family B)